MGIRVWGGFRDTIHPRMEESNGKEHGKIGTMKKKMETTIWGHWLRVSALRAEVQVLEVGFGWV